jgi:hypothetical protein
MGCGMMFAIVRARVLGFLVNTLLLVGASRAWAQGAAMDAAFDLHWSAPADCPDGPHVREEVLRLAGRQAPPSRHLKAQAVLRPDEHQGWILTLTTELDGIAGERHLSGISCQSLSEAASLTLALLLNPEAKIESPPKPAPAALPPPEPKAPPIKKPWPAPVWQVGALAGVEVGVLSEVSPWFGLSLGVGLGRFSLRLLPGFTPPQSVSSQDRKDSGGRLWLVSAAALGCYAMVDGWASLAPCLGANLVRLQGTGWGVREARQASVFWTSAELALRASLPLVGILHMEVWGFGQIPLYKSSVYLDEAGLVSRPAGFGYGARAGLSLAWP